MILPSIIANTQEEIFDRVEKVKGLSKVYHLDIMDGEFVDNTSLNFEYILPEGRYEAHLMVKDPEKWIDKLDDKLYDFIMQMIDAYEDHMSSYGEEDSEDEDLDEATRVVKIKSSKKQRKKAKLYRKKNKDKLKAAQRKIRMSPRFKIRQQKVARIRKQRMALLTKAQSKKKLRMKFDV